MGHIKSGWGGVIRTLDGRVRACCLSILATPQQWLGGRRSKSQPADSKSAALPLELPPSNTSEKHSDIHYGASGWTLPASRSTPRQPASRLANSQILADL